MTQAFDLPAEFNIYNVLETRDALLAWVAEQLANGKGPLVISAREVAEVDGAGLQLLVALSNSHPGWKLLEPTEAMKTACKTLGFSHWLGDKA